MKYRNGIYGDFVPCDPSQQGKETTKILTSDTGSQYVFCNLINKTIYAGEDTQVYENPASKTSYEFVKKGNPIGRLYSFIDYGSYMFLTFETTKGMLGRIVYLKPKTISDKGLKAQKVKTLPEQQSDYDQAVEDEGKKWYEKLGDNFVQGAKWGAIAVGGYLVYDMVKSSQKNTNISGMKKKKNSDLTKLALVLGVGYLIANEAGFFEKKSNSVNTYDNLPLPGDSLPLAPVNLMNTSEYETTRQPIAGFNLRGDFNL